MNIKTLRLSGLKEDNKSVKIIEIFFICSNENLWNGRMYSSSFSSPFVG